MPRNKIPSNRQINGTYGSVWVNGEKWLDVDAFEAKVVINFEDVNMAEDPATHQKMLGWTGEGTMTVKKIYSRGAALMADGVKQGTLPEINLVGKLADPDAFGSERIAINNVTFQEFLLIKFEQKTLGTEELPFRYTDYDPIDLIEA